MKLPSECGYHNIHKEVRWVKMCAQKSQEAFVVLATVCLFAIVANTGLNQSLDCREPEWITACMGEGVNRQWLSDLQNSFVCQFTPGFRAGAFVDPYRTIWAWCFPAFVATHIPLWICWRHVPLPIYDTRLMGQYKPHLDDVNVAKARECQCNVMGLPADRLFVEAGRSIEAPEPYPGSCQKKGKTLEEFVEWMDEEMKEALAMESKDEQEARIVRARQGAMDIENETLEEPTVGMAMFEWINCNGGFQL